MRNLWVLLGLVLLTGCQTAPVKMADYTQGNWKARALIKDKDHSRSYILTLEFNAVRNENLRVDALSTLGQHVASLVSSQSQVQFYTSDSKRFYQGAPKPEVLKSMIGIPMDPRWLQNILFDQPIAAKQWICKNGPDGLVAECHNTAAQLVITWVSRKGSARTVEIVHPRAEIQITFLAFAPKVARMDHLFDLQIPSGYQKAKLK